MKSETLSNSRPSPAGTTYLGSCHKWPCTPRARTDPLRRRRGVQIRRHARHHPYGPRVGYGACPAVCAGHRHGQVGGHGLRPGGYTPSEGAGPDVLAPCEGTGLGEPGAQWGDGSAAKVPATGLARRSPLYLAYPEDRGVAFVERPPGGGSAWVAGITPSRSPGWSAGCCRSRRPSLR